MYAFLGFSTVVTLILLLPFRLKVGRILYLAYWLCLTFVFAIATQEFGYDTANYANFVELYWQEPIEPSLASYMSGSAMILIAKLTSGYNFAFTLILVSLIFVPLMFQREIYSLNFAAAIFPVAIFFALGNFKLGLSFPFIYGYFFFLSRSNLKVASVFLLGAVVMHPQNVILAAMTPLIFFINGVRLKLWHTVLVIFIFGGVAHYVLSRLDELPLFTRYFSDEVIPKHEMGAGARFQLIEAAYQTLFLSLLFLVRREFSSTRLIFIGCVAYHGMRLGLSLIPVLDANLVGRGLLPFMVLDIFVLARVFSSRGLDYRLVYGFQIMALTRLAATLWLGSLANAIETHLN